MQRESAPLVSIITPCYKGGKYLPFSIASVLQQDFKDFELLLIDDKSPDNTREIMQKQWEKSDFDPRIHLLQNEKNLGIVGTRNKALQLAKVNTFVSLIRMISGLQIINWVYKYPILNSILSVWWFDLIQT